MSNFKIQGGKAPLQTMVAGDQFPWCRILFTTEALQVCLETFCLYWKARICL